MHKGVEVEASQHTYAIGFHRTADATLSELPNVATHDKRSVLTTVVREFCGTCNGGWMSRLEARCKPLLQRLWAPAFPLGATAFTQRDVAALAAWATKTAWVRERVAERSNTADVATREEFARTQVVPPLTWVWASRYEGASDFRALTAAITVTHQDQHWRTGEERQVSLCALRFRGLALVVRTDSGPGVPQFSLPTDAWRQLAPCRGGLTWPPVRVVGDVEVEGIVQNVGAWLRMPATSDFVRSGDWNHEHRN